MRIGIVCLYILEVCSRHGRDTLTLVIYEGHMKNCKLEVNGQVFVKVPNSVLRWIWFGGIILTRHQLIGVESTAITWVGTAEGTMFVMSVAAAAPMS
jgi:hypothetical protein